MALFTKFNSFVEAMAEKSHNLGSDTIKLMLTNVAPAAANAVKADITEITAGYGYTAGGATVTVTASSQTSGTYKLVIDDVTFTASGGTMATWRYLVLYNDTATNDELIGFYDNGSAVTLADGNSITTDFSAANGVLQIA